MQEYLLTMVTRMHQLMSVVICDKRDQYGSLLPLVQTN